MPRLEEIANVALRVPSILVLDLLYKCDIDSFTEHLRAKNEDMLFKYKYVIWNLYYLGHLVNMVVLVLPLRHIVKLYLHILTVLLLYVGHQISKDYVRGEVHHGYGGVLYFDSLAFNRFVTALTSQIILSTLCAFLMKTKKVWLFSAHMLPLLARLCAVPHATLLTINSFSMVLTGVGATMFLLSNLFVPYRLARAAYSDMLQLEAIELYRLLAVAISLWNQFAVPVLFSVFWFVLFVVQLCSYTMANNASASHQGLLLFVLTSVSECCATPYSLLGLTFVVSFLALGLLNLCKFYLGGYAAVQNDNVMHRGVTEGVTLLLLALQTGLLDMQALQRTFLLSIILFIVVTSTLQSMIEITDPIILALGASRNRSLWKHFRGLSMCLVLLMFPGYMAYKIAQFFHMDFWLLILVSSCMLTSLQVTGTLLIYSLFMVELFRSDPIDSLDEVIYWVNAVSRMLEFVVALCVVAYGTWESLFGEWSWMGASVIIIHSYFNVWLRAQSGWRSFLLRQEAAKKINSLPRATAQQLQLHGDVCAICFQEMSSAVITYCGHFFHGNCLRKWLYVQETCPMCHQSVRPTMPPPSHQGAGDAQAGPSQRETETEPAAAAKGRDETSNRDPSTQEATQLEAPANPGFTEQQEGKECVGGEEEADDVDEEDRPDGPHRKPVQGLRFSSSGDFVGFASPVSSCSSGHSPSPADLKLEPWDHASYPTNRDSNGLQEGESFPREGAAACCGEEVNHRTKGLLVQSTTPKAMSEGDGWDTAHSGSARAGRQLGCFAVSSPNTSVSFQRADYGERNGQVLTRVDLTPSNGSQTGGTRNSIKGEKDDAREWENSSSESLPGETQKTSIMADGVMPNTEGQTCVVKTMTTTSWNNLVDSMGRNNGNVVIEDGSCCGYSAGRVDQTEPTKLSHEHLGQSHNVDDPPMEGQVTNHTNPSLDLPREAKTTLLRPRTCTEATYCHTSTGKE